MIDYKISTKCLLGRMDINATIADERLTIGFEYRGKSNHVPCIGCDRQRECEADITRFKQKYKVLAGFIKQLNEGRIE